ncbi:type VI secretion system baseplate subunit TssG [Andreprevotia chitinilytica]|uniref:type VI secretion system baseplate subunit TssG n=1 Tax=Andreprevotia chitinilytica TaxID=396808 RepID=UPI000558D865|nr:type VI secretion system baseplate subunit TssG [Andreprevotia chitinilytica]
MASTQRRSPRDLIQELEQGAPQFGFFQSVRLLSLAAKKRGEKRGPLPAKLRFRTLTSLSFPASELVRYQPVDEEALGMAEARDEMTVAFMGLTGPSGVLPNSYTELLIERRHFHRDTGLHAFLDLFSHRSMSLFYSAWRKYRYWLAVEGGEQDGFTRYLLDLSGLGLARLRERLGTDDTAGVDEGLFIHYAGLLSQKPLSGQALVTLIEGFFSVRAEIEQFVGQWIELPASEQTQLGAVGCELGFSAFAGDRIWDRQTKMQLKLGPMRRKQFDHLLPGQAGASALKALMQFALGQGLACDVTMVLDRRDVPKPLVAADAMPLRLGGNVWLNSTPPKAHPDQMCYRLLQ